MMTQLNDCLLNTDPQLQCNAEEAGTRVWLHAHRTPGKKVLVYSTDTDALHIAMVVVNQYVNLYPLGKPKMFSISSLFKSLENNSYLIDMPPVERSS